MPNGTNSINMNAGLFLQVNSADASQRIEFVGKNWRKFKNTRNESIYLSGTILRRSDAQGVELNTSFFENEVSIDFSGIQDLKGTFSLIICGENEAVGYSSAFGIYPIYYTKDSSGGFFLTDDISLYRKFVGQVQLNPITVASAAIFNFPILDDAVVDGFKKIPVGSKLSLTRAETHLTKWYDDSWIYQIMDSSIDYDQINDLFVRTASDYSNGADNAAVSITGGFDGRTVLSALYKELKPKLYTFGVPGSHDLEVGGKVAKKLGLDHLKFLIDDNYFRTQYNDLTRYIITHSNGLVNQRRTHYVLAFSSLSSEANLAFTGNFGSELFRLIKHPGLHIPRIVFEVARNRNTDEVVDREVTDLLTTSPFIDLDSNLLKQAVLERLNRLFSKEDLRDDSYLPFFKFLITETLGNYYGPEMNIESHWIENRSIFMDDEFVELVSRSAYGSRHQLSEETNPIKRRMGQLAYSEIIKRNNKALYRLPTSKGYSPADITSPVGLIKTSASFYTKRFRKSVNEYDSNRSTQEFLRANPINELEIPEWFTASREELQRSFVDYKRVMMNAGAMIYFCQWVNNQEN